MSILLSKKRIGRQDARSRRDRTPGRRNASLGAYRKPGTGSPRQGHKNGDEKVSAWVEDIVLPTYLPLPPDKNPMFLEKRVYQGSSGNVYPLPFTDRIAEKAVDRKWKAVWIENEFIRAMVLPEIGGRIHVLQDKTNGYDVIYNQPVIKPALVGLAGPWISGGIEFNWPQHHRPATFLPVEFEIEEHADGSRTIWCSDYDPISRMKGMHGVCLHPGRSYLELKVRAYNPTPFVQTFLWWANVATRVHEAYQSFFPPDVFSVADHARRSMSEYPLCRGHYYGVDYGERGRAGVPESEVPSQFVPPHCLEGSTALPEASRITSGLPCYAPNDLSFYANIPVPTSYMCMGSKQDFFGGYDYQAQAGIVHYANHHISPGKKQWTWGNHEFGYAWDRNLTDADESGEFAPYIEIMAGVYTDNQPDFSFLHPGETKSWSQFWYPIRRIGPARQANLDAAVSCLIQNGAVKLGVAVTSNQPGAIVSVTAMGKTLCRFQRDLSPSEPLVEVVPLTRAVSETDLRILVTDRRKRELISYQPGAQGAGSADFSRNRGTVSPIFQSAAARTFEDARILQGPQAGKPAIQQVGKPALRARVGDSNKMRPGAQAKGDVPPPASEPPPPGEINSADELYLTGLHLDQYRHATRCPSLYWREALRRDPLDSRCNNAMGLWHLRRGEFEKAEDHFRVAIRRLTRRNANPYDGEPLYNLGLCLRYLERPDEAYDAFYKATWNQAWTGAACLALAEIDCTRRDWKAALSHLNRTLSLDTEHLRARNLKVMALRKIGANSQADRVLQETLELDRLDVWARHLSGRNPDCDLQAFLDVAHHYARAGFFAEAIEVLQDAKFAPRDLPDQSWGALPLVYYTCGWLEQKRGGSAAARKFFMSANAASPDYCFPARLEEIAILQTAMRANPKDARAPYYLGNLLYDRRRHEEAIRLWELSTGLDRTFSRAWRNLGIGYFNIRRQTAKARAAYDLAVRFNSKDARLLFERDQLWKRLGERPEKRLRELAAWPGLVQQRDDLTIELCALYNQTGRHEQAARLIAGRRFQPWEGGEGGPLGQHVRAHLALGREAFRRKDYPQARAHFETALTSPSNLGEAKHLLANQSDLRFWLGCALAGLGDTTAARQQWLEAATFKGDFQEMSVRSFSEMTYYSALAWARLGRRDKSLGLFRELVAHARQLGRARAKIDYFATSLPTMLLFEDDLQFRQETTSLFLQAQAEYGLGRKKRAKSLLAKVLRRDPNHPLAADLLSDWRAGGFQLDITSPSGRRRTHPSSAGSRKA